MFLLCIKCCLKTQLFSYNVFFSKFSSITRSEIGLNRLIDNHVSASPVCLLGPSLLPPPTCETHFSSLSLFYCPRIEITFGRFEGGGFFYTSCSAARSCSFYYYVCSCSWLWKLNSCTAQFKIWKGDFAPSTTNPTMVSFSFANSNAYVTFSSMRTRFLAAFFSLGS